MTHPLPERFSEYLDGALEASEATALEAHVAGCAACEVLLTDLRRVIARAQALEDRAPRAELWPGVAAAIGATPRAPRRVSFSMPQLLAAGVALMLISGGTVAAVLALRAGPVRGPVPVDTSASGVVPVGVRTPDRGYEAAIRELQAEVTAGRGKLDTTTVRVVEEKLKLVDRAIFEAERALAADPANTYLTSHLTETRLRKLELLRRAAALTRAVS